MDFDAILDRWEQGKDRGKTAGEKATGAGEKTVEGGGDWLDRFPPSAEVVGAKEADQSPPVSEGRSVWLRRPHQDTLDLHGLNGKEAEEELARFVRSMRRRGLRKGLVIHGKGLHSPEGSVLGPLVRDFLETSSEIGEFGRAARRDGGSGASWFVLRQRSR